MLELRRKGRKSGSRHKYFLIRYFSNYYTLHRSDLAARAAPLDPRLESPMCKKYNIFVASFKCNLPLWRISTFSCVHLAFWSVILFKLRNKIYHTQLIIGFFFNIKLIIFFCEYKYLNRVCVSMKMFWDNKLFFYYLIKKCQ